MPELTDQQLKDRVQKLENLLRVSGSFAYCAVCVHECNGLNFFCRTRLACSKFKSSFIGSRGEDCCS